MWTVSAGNAALGVAYAARLAGVSCSVMIMDTAPAAKVDAINRLGASIVRVTYDGCAVLLELDGRRGRQRVNHLNDLFTTSMSSSLTRTGSIQVSWNL